MKFLTMLLMVMVVLFLYGCTTAKVKVTDDSGIGWDIRYTTFGKKDLKDVRAAVGNIEFSLGSSSQDTPTLSNAEIACILAPELCANR